MTNLNMSHSPGHRFMSETDCEVMARVARVWDEDSNLDAAALDLGDVVLKGGWWQGDEGKDR